MQEDFKPLRPCQCFFLFPTIPSQLAELDEEGEEDKGEGPGAPLEVAEEEEVDCELDVCVDVEPVEEDVEEYVHRNRFELSKIHLGVVSSENKQVHKWKSIGRCPMPLFVINIF